MKESNGYAEQCKDWSEAFPTDCNGNVAQAATHNWQTTPDLPSPAHSWLLDYAVHALWQTPVSLRDGTGAWPQVLSVGEPSWPTPDFDLCSTRYGGTGAGAVSPTADRAHAHRRAVRHWLRITHAPGGHVTKSDVADQLACGGVCDRYHGGQSPRGQYVGARLGQSALAHIIRRGETACARR